MLQALCSLKKGEKQLLVPNSMLHGSNIGTIVYIHSTVFQNKCDYHYCNTVFIERKRGVRELHWLPHIAQEAERET